MPFFVFNKDCFFNSFFNAEVTGMGRESKPAIFFTDSPSYKKALTKN
jgi:hypothetical protein